MANDRGNAQGKMGRRPQQGEGKPSPLRRHSRGEGLSSPWGGVVALGGARAFSVQ
ncbi:MAG TPA: hypothetical protein VF844_02820 [Ktedonobacteraceae bacterium]